MKYLSIPVLTLALVICCGLQAIATVRTVNNGSYLPANPGQYTTISSAISAASAGDTILVAGSLTSYAENLTISKLVTIIGAGYNPQSGPSSVLSGSITFSTAACAGSTVIGFMITGNVTENATNSYSFNNITLFRNYILSGVNFTSVFNYLTIKENIFYVNSNLTFNNAWAQCQYVVVQNNIFLDDSHITIGNVSTTTPQMVIDHNLFLGGDYSYPSVTVYGGTSCYYCYGINGYSSYALYTTNALISNNIFYGVVPIDTVNTSQYNNNTFNNNLTYASTTIKALPWGTNIGVSNINNANPLFTSLFTSSSQAYLSLSGDNLRPQTGSPVLYAATDSTNIGPTGGQFPVYDVTNPYLSGEPPMPFVQSITPVGSTSVHAGTPFVIQVSAKEIK